MPTRPPRRQFPAAVPEGIHVRTPNPYDDDAVDLDELDEFTADSNDWTTVLGDLWEERREIVDNLRRHPADAARLGAVALVVLALIGAVLAIVWMLLRDLFHGLTAASHAGAVAGVAIGHHLHILTRVVVDPVHTYITDHAAGLPATPSQLWWTWLIVTTGLWLLAAAGSTGARIGWTLLGAATVAMVWAASPIDAHQLAAGVALTAWSALSVPAFVRWRHNPEVDR